MSPYRAMTITVSSHQRLLMGAIAAALLLPTPSPAFFQSTSLEGTVGTDIGGVWLSMQQLMPEFRITYPKSSTNRAMPFAVAPVPADLEPVTGKNPGGVVITDCLDAALCAENSLLIGDMVIKVNSTDITDVASFEKAFENLPATVLLSVRRPALKMSTARLLKIRYSTEGKETAEGSVQQEKLILNVLDVALPFADALEATRQSHAFFQPSAAQLETLGKTWFELPENQPLRMMKAGHRFVAQSSFDDALAGDKSLVNSKYAVIMDMDGNPVQGAAGKVIDVYGIESVNGDTMDGSYVTVTMASAPFPINVEFKGRFHMTRVAPWSDEDDKLRAKRSQGKAPEKDLSQYKTLPDVPAQAKPAAKPK